MALTRRADVGVASDGVAQDEVDVVRETTIELSAAHLNPPFVDELFSGS